MEIIGEIQSIRYQNEINSYTIAQFETEEEETTVVGYLPFVNEGDYLKLVGQFVEHKSYGRQFKIDTFEKMMPKNEKSIEKYLANGNIKGIGEALAKRIVKKFGKETINIFKFEPEKLAEIKGISLNKSKEMAEEFMQNWEVWQIVGFLDKFGIGAESAKKVYDLLGKNAIQEIENDPYVLIDIARGVDFKQIDMMAIKLGISYDSQKRVKSGIKYGLIKNTYNGNSCILKSNLIEFVISLLDVTTDVIENSIIELKTKNEIKEEKRENEEYIYLSPYYIVEEEITWRIKKLKNAKNMKKITAIEKELKKVEVQIDIELSQKQKEAVKLVNEENVIIITGGPGTGKTTIIKAIIDIYEKKGKKVILAAPTRKSCKKND